MKRYRVTLSATEREELGGLLARGKADVRKLKHAQILLKADEAAGGPAWGDERIAHLDALRRRIAHRAHRRNAAGSKVAWQFTTADARIKLRSLYPSLDG